MDCGCKGYNKKTNWEHWWSWCSGPILETMSNYRPPFSFDQGDYSWFGDFLRTDGQINSINTNRFVSDVEFCSKATLELELVDIVVTATRRALKGHLQPVGWMNIPQLMIDRDECYLNLLGFERPSPSSEPYMRVQHRTEWGKIANKYFCSNGKQMLAPRFRFNH